MRSLRRSACLLAPALVVFCVAAAACDDDSTDSTTASDASADRAIQLTLDGALTSPYTLDNVCELTAPKICDLRKGCCEQTAGFDRAGCEAHERARCDKNVAEVKAGTMVFNGLFIDGCLSSLKPLIDRCKIPFSELSELAGAFSICRTFVGKRADGADCERDEQCTPTSNALSVCDKKTQKCSTVRFVSGGACTATGTFQCAKGTYCGAVDAGAGTTSSSLCIATTPLGQPCNKSKADNLECGLGYRCDATSGTCAVGRAGGEPCTSAVECASLDCTSAKTCAPQEALASPAECKGP